MKRLHYIITGYLALVAIFYSVLGWAGEIRGGVIDTGDRSIAIVEELDGDRYMLAELIEPVERHNMKGRLFIVYPRGNFRELNRSFRDRFGAFVWAPRDNMDKVVYLDWHGGVKGVIGMSRWDMNSLARAHPDSFGRSRHLYELVGDMVDEKMDAVRHATAAFSTDMAEDDQLRIFNSTIEMLVGRQFANAVSKIIENFAVDCEASSIGRSVDGLTPLAGGIYIMTEDDNGGFGLVFTEDDNGGFGYVATEDDNGGFGRVATEDDNGGFGYVATEDDNGGFGSIAIVQGWAIDPDLPPLPNVDMNLGGIMFMVLE